MDAEMERKWALAKAEIFKVQAAYLTILLYRSVTFEDLKRCLRENITELENMAREYREEAGKNEPDGN